MISTDNNLLIISQVMSFTSFITYKVHSNLEEENGLELNGFTSIKVYKFMIFSG